MRWRTGHAGRVGALDSAQAQARRRNPPPSLLGNLFGARAGQAYRDMQGLPGAGAGSADALARHDAVVHGVLADVAAAEARDLIAERDRIMSRVLHASFLASKRMGRTRSKPSTRRWPV